MTVDRLIRHFRAREYMELCGDKIDTRALRNTQHKHDTHFASSLRQTVVLIIILERSQTLKTETINHIWSGSIRSESQMSHRVLCHSSSAKNGMCTVVAPPQHGQ